jgi:hypothetical protein
VNKGMDIYGVLQKGCRGFRFYKNVVVFYVGMSSLKYKTAETTCVNMQTAGIILSLP